VETLRGTRVACGSTHDRCDAMLGDVKVLRPTLQRVTSCNAPDDRATRRVGVLFHRHQVTRTSVPLPHPREWSVHVTWDAPRGTWQGFSELQLLELPCTDPGLLARRSNPAASPTPTSASTSGPDERECGYSQAVSSFCRRLACSPLAVCLLFSISTSSLVVTWLALAPLAPRLPPPASRTNRQLPANFPPSFCRSLPPPCSPAPSTHL